MPEQPANLEGEQPRAGRSWTQIIIQIVMFQLIFRLFARRPQQPIRDTETGDIIPSLKNAFPQNTTYDVFIYLSSSRFARLNDLSEQDPIWFLSAQKYIHDSRSLKGSRLSHSLSVEVDEKIMNSIVDKSLDLNILRENVKGSSTSMKSVLGNFNAQNSLKIRADMMRHWESLYILIFAVPHFAYKATFDRVITDRNFSQLISMIERKDMIAKGSQNMIEYMRPVKGEQGRNLLDSPEDDEDLNDTENVLELPHWKNSIDMRMVVDHNDLQPTNFYSPHIKRYVMLLPEEGLYLPIVHPCDVWLLEKNYDLLNKTSIGLSLPLNLTFSTVSPFWWMVEAQMNDMWNPDEKSPPNPLTIMEGHIKRESMIFKKVLLDTNPYLLGFSASFMLLHALFSMLAFKNEISFWRNNKSMEGLSALSLLFNFFCEIIIALYLYDSENTSFLILLEIFTGVAISAWKVTKALDVKFCFNQYRLPIIYFTSKKGYDESKTQDYDVVAIKFMSTALMPCVIGYALYSLKTNKFKSWYSFIIRTLAGTVYTFGFVMMTPQLYINYKLKSVDHLPWRAFTYKALNTFVDDVAAFVIDMPWMHRLACFRDDLIFLCYLYQRWIYSVDKSRPSEWSSEEEAKLLSEDKQTVKFDNVKVDSSKDLQLQKVSEIKEINSSKDENLLIQRRKAISTSN